MAQTLIDVEMLRIAGSVLAPGGVAWLAVKHSLNGLKRDVSDVKEKVTDIKAQAAKIETDLADSRDLLVRHDERISAIKETLDRRGAS